MKAKYSVMLMWWVMVIALPVSVPSVLLGAPPSAPGLGKLQNLPKLSKTLSFSSKGELKLLLQQQPPAYPGIVKFADALTAANADPISKRVWAVSLYDGKPEQCIVGFQTTTLRNTGSSSVSGVTVTVTANMLKLQSAIGWNKQLEVIIYDEHGHPLDNIYTSQPVHQTGTQSVTSPPFTMEPNHDYYAEGLIS